MSKTETAKLELPPVDQVGFVYRSLEAAMALYRPLFGDFEVLETGSIGYRYRGREEPAELRVGFARSGAIEIELIEWVSGGCPHKEFIERGREGLHHLRFPVASVDAQVARAQAIGWEPIWHKRFAEGLAMAYMERAGDPLLIELFENRHDE